MWLTGFTDGEGSFILNIYQNKEIKIGWHVRLEFLITLHEKDKALLEQIQNYWNLGNLRTQDSREKVYFYVRSIEDLAKIINHFNLYPLKTQKLADYLLFKEAYNLILNKEHLTLSGLQKLIAIRAAMNLGLTDELQIAFPNVKPSIRPLVPLYSFSSIEISDLDCVSNEEIVQPSDLTEENKTI